jgi:SAM-dependent MidA family methyltransferase
VPAVTAGGLGDARLVERIRDEISASAGRRITFARYMELALTEPGLGYYATSELRPTRAGDFLTAPELHPLFGRCLGRLVAAAAGASASSPFRVLEYGAGRGTLRDTAGTGLEPEVRWTRSDLPGRSEAPASAADLILANEYLDALPVHRLRMDGRLLEMYVAWREDGFVEVADEPSTPELAAYLQAEGVSLRPGQRAAVCLEAPRWVAHVARQLVPGGCLLVIDYGHEAAELYGARRMAGSLLTYRGHEVSDDPYHAVGQTDITAHVDISALERAAAEAGLRRIGSTSQGRLLAQLGLGELLMEMGRQPGIEPGAYIEARAAVARLLDPRHLGGFRVLAWARPDDTGQVPILPGFGDSP